MSAIRRMILDAAEVELRAEAGEKPKIAGYAAVYNSQSEDLGGFREIIRPGAFDDALKEEPDVSARIQHDGGLTTIGRTSNGTLKVWSDKKGLRYEIDPPDTQAGRDIVELVRRGDINKSSFAFSLRDDPNKPAQNWFFESDPPLRELLNLNLHDVAPVDGPAYEATTAEIRSSGETAFAEARAAFEQARREYEPQKSAMQLLEERLRQRFANRELRPYS